MVLFHKFIFEATVSHICQANTVTAKIRHAWEKCASFQAEDEFQ